MLARWAIRVATSLAGIVVGILVSSAVLSKFSIDASVVVAAILIFWLVRSSNDQSAAPRVTRGA